MPNQAINFRPLGMKSRRMIPIFRTATPERIGPVLARHLADDLKVDCFIDLRSASEIDRYGAADHLVAAGISTVYLPLSGYDNAAITRQRPNAGDYLRYYQTIMEQADKPIARVLNHITEQHRPFVFGCHAGKDRTGIIAACLMTALGFDARDIAEDYALSQQFLIPQIDAFADKWQRKGLSRSDYAHRLKTPPATMARLMVWIGQQYGGTETFMSRIGVDTKALTRRINHIATEFSTLPAFKTGLENA